MQHQHAQMQYEQTGQRLDRMLARWPDFVDMANLQITPDDTDTIQSIVVTANDVYHASRQANQYKFRVQMAGKEPMLVIDRTDNQPTALLRWPVELAQANCLVVATTSDTAQSGLAGLATSDWQFLQALSQSTYHALQRGDFDLLGEPEFKPDVWQQALAQLGQVLQAANNSLRYDTVKLKREQVNPDYEHLWLQFSNLYYQGQQWPQAELRFSAALVKKKGFSVHPKLEFPQSERGLPLFENWQADLEDDYGVKMELRCEVKSQAVDVNFWHGLTKKDQQLVLALITHLPSFLAELEMQKVAIHRAWQDWQNLAQAMITTMNARALDLGITPIHKPMAA